MVRLTVITEPVNGYVTIKDMPTDRILAQGTAPQSAYQSGTWIYQVQFGDVLGYIKPREDAGMITIDRTNTYTYTPKTPPPPSEYTLTVTATEGGTVEPAVGTHTYASGTLVVATASPAEGYDFRYFELDGERVMDNPTQFGMSSDRRLHAVFTALSPPPPPSGEVFVIYREGEPQHDDVPGTGDTRSAELISKTYRYTLRALTAEELEPGFVAGDIYPECNLVMVGGPDANPYAGFYFPEETIELTCSRSPPYVVLQRSRGETILILVEGCEEKDTWMAAKKFCGKGVPLWAKVGGVAVLLGAVAYGAGKLFGGEER